MSRTQTAFATTTAAPEHAGPHQRVVEVFATAWSILWKAWLGVLVALVLAVVALVALVAATGQGPFGGAAASGMAQAVAHPLALVVLAAAVLATWYAFVAVLYLTRQRRRALAADYVLRPVRRLSADDFVPRYIEEVYLPRRDAADGSDADARARVMVHAAAHRRAHTGRPLLGICITGRSGQGKTRLAWELARAELAGWTLLAWPHDALRSFDFQRLRGHRVLLWLDDLHELATPTEAATVTDLPRRIAAHAAEVVVVATCRDGADERRVRRHFSALLEQLHVIRLAPITDEEADALVAALRKVYFRARRDQFDGTPGSILLAIRRMRDERFPRLSREAKDVLWALVLLRSAGIYSYPFWRVRLAAIEVFGMRPKCWRRACQELVEVGYVRVRRRGPGDEGFLSPVSAAYLDEAIPPPHGAAAETTDDWAALQAVFERHRDVYALLRLGRAFNEVSKAMGTLLPPSLRIEKQRGVLCVREALTLASLDRDQARSSVALIELGEALASRAELTEGILRTDFWMQAAQAYHEAAESVDREVWPARWALAQLRLAHVYEHMGADELFTGTFDQAVPRFESAALHAVNALGIYTAEHDPVHYADAEGVRARVLDTLRGLAAR